jgi:hypothetical protein
MVIEAQRHYKPRTDTPLFTPVRYYSERPSRACTEPALSDPVSTYIAELNQRQVVQENRSWTARLARLIPESYWEPREFERRNHSSFYEGFGILLFKKYLPTSGDLVRRANRFLSSCLAGGYQEVGGDHSLLLKERWTRIYEAMHLVGAAMMIGLSIFAPNPSAFATNVVVNTLVNIYPIMLQRYNRARLYNAIDRRIELRQQHNLEDEPEQQAVMMRRAVSAGLSVLNGGLRYSCPELHKGFFPEYHKSRDYHRRICKVGLSEQGAIHVKVGDAWHDCELTISQVLAQGGQEASSWSPSF